MELSQTASMRMGMEQRPLLTPRMIQSMEILQLPLLALEERIEQELENNPVLEVRDANSDPEAPAEDSVTQDGEALNPRNEFSEGEQPMVVNDNGDAADFERLSRISEYL